MHTNSHTAFAIILENRLDRNKYNRYLKEKGNYYLIHAIHNKTIVKNRTYLKCMNK